jgi:hypothetical protein
VKMLDTDKSLHCRPKPAWTEISHEVSGFRSRASRSSWDKDEAEKFNGRDRINNWLRKGMIGSCELDPVSQ